MSFSIEARPNWISRNLMISWLCSLLVEEITTSDNRVINALCVLNGPYFAAAMGLLWVVEISKFWVSTVSYSSATCLLSAESLLMVIFG